jgi:hypothetical protein
MQGVLVGGCVGGVLGAAGRSTVIVLFVYYVSNWGGRFYDGDEEAGATLGEVLTRFLFGELGGLLMISALLGLLIGGLSGATCRPLIGGLIGGILSPLPCLMIVLPANFLMSISTSFGGGDFQADRFATVGAMFSMIVVGAATGSISAAIGRRVMHEKTHAKAV